MKSVCFDPEAWEQYTDWQRTDKSMVKRINLLLVAIMLAPFEGIGKPEPLKHDLAGFWSRRINDEHRLVYRVLDNQIQVIQVRYHYGS